MHLLFVDLEYMASQTCAWQLEKIIKLNVNDHSMSSFYHSSSTLWPSSAPSLTGQYPFLNMAAMPVHSTLISV